MNDNKRLEHKLTTWFWWLIASLPLIFVLGGILFNVFNDNILTYDFENNILSYWNDFYNNLFLSGKPFSSLKSGFDSLITNTFGLSNNNYFIQFVIIQFYWFIVCYFLHLVVDLFLILPRVCQRCIERL